MSVFGTSISEVPFCTKYPLLIERFIAQIGSLAIGGVADGFAFSLVVPDRSVGIIWPFLSILQKVDCTWLNCTRYCQKCVPTNPITSTGFKKVVPSAVTPSELIGRLLKSGAGVPSHLSAISTQLSVKV